MRPSTVVQSFAGLLICRPDWTIQAYSECLPSLVTTAIPIQPDLPFDQVFGRQFAHDVRGHVQSSTASSDPSFNPGVALGDVSVDVGCSRAGDVFVLTVEAGRPGRAVAPDALARRYLQRLGAAQSLSEAAVIAGNLMRLFLRVDSVSVIGQDDAGELDVLASVGSRAPALIREQVHAEALAGLTSGMGVVADATADVCRLIGEAPDESALPALVRQPGPALLDLLALRQTRSASWYLGPCARGMPLIALAECAMPPPPDMARRKAADLATQVLALMLDARAAVAACPQRAAKT